ncbi:MAG: hypothetical protein IT383_22665 [Deltaproteobacteria bacterium]|nr:hypothetical protein [Deltaproteobacteria bacterium]
MRTLVALALLTLALGCGMKVGKLRTGADTAAKKDCAACEKMCAVAGDAEGNPDAVAACKADCKKSCSG